MTCFLDVMSYKRLAFISLYDGRVCCAFCAYASKFCIFASFLQKTCVLHLLFKLYIMHRITKNDRG